MSVRSRRRLRFGNRDLPFQAVLIVFGIVTFFPLVLVVITSLKSNTQFYHNFWLPELPVYFGNYSSAFRIIWRYIVNSVIYSGSTICVIAALASVAWYVFARFRFPFKSVPFPRVHHADYGAGCFDAGAALYIDARSRPA